jgi:hypothetical protein
MTISPNSFEFQLLFVFSMCVLVFKLIIILFLGRQIVRKTKEDGYLTIDLFFGTFLLVVALFVTRIFLVYFDFYLTEFDPERYYLMPNILVYKIAQLITFLGILAIVFITETKVLELKTKGYISYALLVPALFLFFYPVNSAAEFAFYNLLNIMLMSTLAPIPLIYFYIGIKNPAYRKSSLLFATGVAVYVIGTVIVGEAILSSIRSTFGPQSHLFVYFLNLVLKFVGLAMAAYGISNYVTIKRVKKEKKYEKKAYPIMKKMEAEAKMKFVELLAMSNPGDISHHRHPSEEEVSFFREQNVCIVCRGDILYYNFMCDCHALYCEKCAHAIEDAENACWACNSPIDESKPTTPFEEEIIEERAQERKTPRGKNQ